jgi:hypothetical protein
MAIFNISPQTSALTTANGDHAFDNDTAQADTLNVLTGAFLRTEGLNARGALLGATGAWRVNVEGRVISEQSIGIELAGPASTINSSMLVATQGVVAGVTGILAGRNVSIRNDGRIVGTENGIALDNAGVRAILNNGTIAGGAFSIIDLNPFNSGILSNDRVINNGTLNGTVFLRNGNDSVRNFGTVNGAVDLGEGDDTIINSGVITEGVAVGGGTNRVNNSGFIGGGVGGGEGNDTVDNRVNAQIGGGVALSFGTNRLTNAGSIGGNVTAGDGNDTIVNSGRITGGLWLQDGTNVLDNRGAIWAGFFPETTPHSYRGGDGVDNIRNSGTMSDRVNLLGGADRLNNRGTIGGDVLGGAGNDTVINNGLIIGMVDLGADDDTFVGGNNVDRVRDNDGTDNVRLGGGADIYFAVGGTGNDGTDTIDGGADADMYDASAATSRLVINLDTVAHNQSPAFPPSAFNPGSGPNVARNLTTGDTDNITGFEHARGGAGGDTIFGSGLANVLDGGANNDNLFGFGQNDTLVGGAGMDMLFGGAGMDMLIGGTEADRFFYEAASDTGLTAATRDVIMDFQDGIDSIDLRNIDTIPNNGIANDPFDFMGVDVAFQNGLSGQLRAITVGDGWIIEGDIDGNGAAEFSIKVFDPTHTITWTDANFDL